MPDDPNPPRRQITKRIVPRRYHYAGWLPPTPSVPEVVGLDVVFPGELEQFNEIDPYVVMKTVRQVCFCPDQVCSAGHCCLLDLDEQRCVRYEIPIIYKNEFAANRSMDCCTSQYIDCINTRYGANIVFNHDDDEEDLRYQLIESSARPYVLQQGESCVDLRNRYYEE